MLKTRLERQQFHDKCKSYKANPCFDEVEGSNGVLWVRDRPMKCPVCKDVFFSYQPKDAPMEPYKCAESVGKRETCGNPLCIKAEEDNYYKNNEEYQRACENYYTPKADQPILKKAPKKDLQHLT